MARSASSSAGPSGGNSSTPEGSRKHLKPSTPPSCSGPSCAPLPGIAPPQKPTSTWQRPAAAARLTASAAGSTVGGRLFSGMSTMVVTPPAAAAAVAVPKPSQSARPGSLTCTCVSTRPGSRTTSPASSTTRRAVRVAVSGSTAAIVPSLTATQPGPSPSGVTIRCARSSSSNSATSSRPGRRGGAERRAVRAPPAVAGDVRWPPRRCSSSRKIMPNDSCVPASSTMDSSSSGGSLASSERSRPMGTSYSSPGISWPPA